MAEPENPTNASPEEPKAEEPKSAPAPADSKEGEKVPASKSQEGDKVPASKTGAPAKPSKKPAKPKKEQSAPAAAASESLSLSPDVEKAKIGKAKGSKNVHS